MKFYQFPIILAVLSFVLFSSCKTEFEKIRTGGDTELIYNKANAYYENGEYLKAQTLYELIIGNYRGKKEAEEIYFRYAYTHYYLKKYILASYYFKNFTNTFSTSQFKEESDFMVAMSNYKLSPNFRLDQSYSAKAIDAFQLFVNTYQNSERVAECNNLIDELRAKMEKKAFNQAELYYNLKQYQAAERAFDNMLQEFPETQNAEKIRFLVTKANFLLAENSVDEKKEERFSKTIDLYHKFVNKFPKSEYEKELNSIYTTSNKKLKEFTNVRY